MSPPRAGTIEFTPTPATYAPSAVRYLSRSPGYAARTIVHQAAARRNSFATWQASASARNCHCTAVRWWKKTSTAWRKWPKSARVIQAPAAA